MSKILYAEHVSAEMFWKWSMSFSVIAFIRKAWLARFSIDTSDRSIAYVIEIYVFLSLRFCLEYVTFKRIYVRI